MKLCVVGTGYVGLVTASCFADAGHDVVGVDTDESKVASLGAGTPTIYEPELEDLLRRALENESIRFTVDLSGGVKGAEVVFVCVGTPSGPNGEADLSAVFSCAREMLPSLSPNAIVVMKSTVPVGTNDALQAELSATAGREVEVASNPEFLKEGTAVDDFLRPDRVILGARSRRAAETLRDLYEPFVRTGAPIIVTDPRSAEMGKYAANGMLSCRISFMNEMSRICDAAGADVEMVRRIVGSDRRVGGSFLFPGPGYGGSCFPKDVRALSALGDEAGIEVPLVKAVDRTNTLQMKHLAGLLQKHFADGLAGKTVAVWGLAFKPRTDDVRESPALAVVQSLLGSGASVAAFDPAAVETARHALGADAERIRWAKDRYDAARDADALLLATEWAEFRRPDPKRLAAAMKGRVVFDGRNALDPRSLARAGFTVYSIGRPLVKPD